MSTDYDPSELEIRSGAAEPTPEPEPKPEEEVASAKPAAAQMPESKAGSATQPPAENASEEATKRRISPRQLRHRKRNRILAATTVLLIATIVGVAWSAGALQKEPEQAAAIVPPETLFAETCQKIRQEERATLYVHQYEVTDELVLSEITDLQSLKNVIFDKGKVTDQTAIEVAKLPKLQHLRLRLSPITDTGAKAIAESKTLWYLNLPHSELTVEGIGALAQIPKLRHLRVGSPHLSNNVTHVIAGFPALRAVHLIGVPITDDGLKILAAMPYLESLYLDDAAVTEAGWQWLFDEHPHLHVHVNQQHHDRDPQAHIHH